MKFSLIFMLENISFKKIAYELSVILKEIEQTRKLPGIELEAKYYVVPWNINYPKDACLINPFETCNGVSVFRNIFNNNLF